MDDLLKEAIADAKAVRETAIANAKLALEEAFTPRLQNMLSQKIQNEIEEEDEWEEEEGAEDGEGEEKEEGSYHEDDEVPGDDEAPEDEVPADDEVPVDDVDESEIIEIDGVKYAPVVSEEDDEEEAPADDEVDADDGEEDDELDLEAVIKELEAELSEDDEMDESKEDLEEGYKEEEEEDAKKESKEVKEEDEVNEEEDVDESKEEVKEEDEFNLDEILDALKEDEESTDEVSKLRTELDETREAVKFMRGKLNEVNLLNAKLLFTNKLFRAYGLSNEQKMKVVETFDRATNIREVKLVYSTMAETFGAKKTEIKESKGSASKAVASTKSEKQSEVITEGDTMRDRFKKLANII